uniref:HEPN domain-containing protein n=1 Tax=Thermoanaerobaculum aquaticum TaxID=1312852 RepID=A0A7V2EF62_9BACT
MTNLTLAQSYLVKAQKRLKALAVLLSEEAYSDVVREAQEIVELALKGMLRAIAVDPPRWHDVGGILKEVTHRFAPEVQEAVPELAAISQRLRREREFAFYGDDDFIPTSEYSREDGQKALEDAQLVVAWAARVIPPPEAR